MKGSWFSGCSCDCGESRKSRYFFLARAGTTIAVAVKRGARHRRTARLLFWIAVQRERGRRLSTSSEPIKESLPKFGSLDGQLEVQPVAGLSMSGGLKLIHDVHFAALPPDTSSQ